MKSLDYGHRRRFVEAGLLQRAGGGGAAAPIANLLGWYDASDAATRYQDSALTTLATADTDPVGGLKDKSGLGRHLLQTTSGNRPQLKLAVQNGLPALLLATANTANDQLFIDLTTIAQPFAVFAVAKSDAGATSYRSLTGGSPTGNNCSLYLDSTSHGMSLYAGGAVLGTADDRGAAQMFIGVFNQNSVQTVVRKNGVQTATGNVSTGSANSFAIGASIGTNFWQGDIMEVFWCSGLPSLAAIQAAEAYLQIKWATPALGTIIRDDFTTTASAPLSSPRTAEPGPGTLTLVQTDGQLSTSGDNLVFPAQTTAAWGDQGFYEAGGRTRVAGRTLLSKFQASNFGAGGLLSTWLTAAALNTSGAGGQAGGLTALTSSLFAQDLSIGLPYASTVDTTYQYALVLRSTGCFYYIKGGTFTNWTLLFVSGIGNQATLYPGVSNYNAVATMDTFRVFDLPAPFTTDYGIATQNVASPSGDYTATADQIIDLTLTAPGVLANEAGIIFRKLDANNYWRAYFNSSGAVRLDSVSAGVATNRLAVAAVIAGGATVTLRVVMDGSTLDVYTLAGTTWTKRGGQVSLSHQNTQTTVAPDIGVGWSGANLRSYPRTSSQYDVLDTFLA